MILKNNLTKFLGVFSLGLGLAELVAPRVVTQKLDMPHEEPLVRGYGLREILSGARILTAKDPTSGLWARVAGDGMDLATLAKPMLQGGNARRNAIIAAVVIAGITAVDIYAAKNAKGDTAQ